MPHLIALFLPLLLGFPGGTVVKNLPAIAGDTRDRDLILGLGRSPGVGTINPLQYSCLEWTEELGGYRPWGSQRVNATECTCSLLFPIPPLPGDSGLQGSARWRSIGRELCLLRKRDRLAETSKNVAFISYKELFMYDLICRSLRQNQ